MVLTMITEDQVNFFHIFGFLKLPGLFKDDIGWMTEEFEKVFVNANVHHSGDQTSNIAPFIDKTEKLSALLEDERIEAVASALLGEDFNYLNSDGKFYSGNTLWHRDGLVQDKVRFIKFAFYLDPVDGNSGALRVIPGSHHLDDQFGNRLGSGFYLNEVKKPTGNDYWGMSGPEIPAQTLDTTPGDLVIFKWPLFHSSWGGGLRRRMFTMNLSERIQEEDNAVLAKVMSWYPQGYSDTMLNTVTGKGRKHLEQGLAYLHSIRDNK